jgi:hypothetical protein
MKIMIPLLYSKVPPLINACDVAICEYINERGAAESFMFDLEHVFLQSPSFCRVHMFMSSAFALPSYAYKHMQKRSNVTLL